MKAKQKDIYKIQAQICKALANEKRLEIIHLLGERKRCYAADLMEAVGLTKTNLSQHMRVLKEAEIVGIERVGNAGRLHARFAESQRSVRDAARVFSRARNAARRDHQSEETAQKLNKRNVVAK